MTGTEPQAASVAPVLRLTRLMGSAENAIYLARTLPGDLTGCAVLIEGRECAMASETFCEVLVAECMDTRFAAAVVVRGAPSDAMQYINHAVCRRLAQRGPSPDV